MAPRWYFIFLVHRQILEFLIIACQAQEPSGWESLA